MSKGMRFNGQPRTPRVIRLGSDCSGMDAAHFSMAGLRAPFVNKFTSDILKEARLVQENISKPKKIYPDMLARKPQEETEVDVYVWTPPCQDLSSAGKGAGFGGQRQTGKLVARSLAFIKRRRPRLTIMEEVPRILAKKFRAKLLGILMALKQVGYKIYWKTVAAHNCEVPAPGSSWWGSVLTVFGTSSNGLSHASQCPPPLFWSRSIRKLTRLAGCRSTRVGERWLRKRAVLSSRRPGRTHARSLC